MADIVESSSDTDEGLPALETLPPRGVAVGERVGREKSPDSIF